MAPSINPTEARIVALERAIEDIRDAVVTIARLEERHAETREAISRCFQVSEKNAEAIVATNAAILVAKESSRERDTALRTEYESMRLQMERIEGRMRPLEELRGFVVRAVIGVVGMVGIALVGLVLVRG